MSIFCSFHKILKKSQKTIDKLKKSHIIKI
nr:MAG TPA: hypothetical protein [Caudoviricetes sp.]